MFLIDGLQLDEDQRQAVDEADEVGAAVVVRHAQTLNLQFPHGEEPVVCQRIAEIDHLAHARIGSRRSLSRHSTGTPPRMKP